MKNFKSIMCFLILAMVIFTWPAAAGEITVLPQYKIFIDSENMGAATGLKVAVGNGVYIFGSVYKNLAPTYMQQQLAKIDVVGVGFGISEKLTENLKLCIDAGYFSPQVSQIEGTGREAMTYYINDRVGNKPRQDFDYDVGGAFGASISLHLAKQVSKHCSFSLNMGYDALSLPSKTTAYDNDSGNLNEFNDQLNCSGPTFGFGWTWKF